jgi:hypothetical protein
LEGGLRARRKDGNHNTIQDYLIERGWAVYDTSRFGDGFPDMIVSRCFPGGKRFTSVVEVKDPTKPKADRQLTPEQKEWAKNWEGEYIIAETPEQAHSDLSLALMGLECFKCKGTEY